jgi:hypothetical protein
MLHKKDEENLTNGADPGSVLFFSIFLQQWGKDSSGSNKSDPNPCA